MSQNLETSSSINMTDNEPGQIESPNRGTVANQSRKTSSGNNNSSEPDMRENYCEPCDLQLNNSVSYKQHLLGLRHAKRVEEMGLKVHDPIDNALGELQSARLVTFLQKETEPVIGLDSLTEKVCTTRSSEDPSYYCELCDAEFDMDGAFNHVTSTQHRFVFLKTTRANLISDLIDNNGDLTTDQKPQIIRAKLLEASMKLESEIGRGNPKIVRVVSTRNLSYKGQSNPRVAAVAPSSRLSSFDRNPVIQTHRFINDQIDYRRRRGFENDRFNMPRNRLANYEREVNPQPGIAQRFLDPFDDRVTILNNLGSASDSRFSERSVEDQQFLLRERERSFPVPAPPPVRIPYASRGMPSHGASYLDVDAPQGERDYTLPTERLLPGEVPDVPSRASIYPRSSAVTAPNPAPSFAPAKRRRLGNGPPSRFSNRRGSLEEGEDADYDSMLDQYRQQKEVEWKNRNQSSDVPVEREDSPPPSKEIFFQKYVREMHQEWEKWYEEKKQKEEAEKATKEKKTSSAASPEKKAASNLKECKSILAQCRIKDDGDAETAIEISRALAEAHVQYKLRYMKPEEKTKEVQDIYKVVLGYLREMQSGKLPNLNMNQVMPQQAAQTMYPYPGSIQPNMYPTQPGQYPYPVANQQYPNPYGPYPQQGQAPPAVANPSQPPWVTQQQQSTPIGTTATSQEESTNPLMMGSNPSSQQTQQRLPPVAPAQGAYVPTSSYYQTPVAVAHTPGQALPARNATNATSAA